MILAISGIRKFWTRSATIVSLVIAVALVVLEFVAVGAAYRGANGTETAGLDKTTVTWLLTFPGAFDSILAIVFEFLAIVGLIYVATASGSEWTWGTLKVAVARGQSRWQYTIATFASLAIILLIGMVITYAAGILAVVIGSSIAGLPLGNPADPAQLGPALVKLVRCGVGLVTLASVGFAVAMIAKNQMAGIGTIIVYFVASILSQALLPDVIKEALKYQPFNISSDAIGLQGPPGTAPATTAVDANVALLITVAWLIGCLAVAAFAVERTEITN